MMALASGSQLGPYQIVALLGVGGMGEVYRACDTRLKRDVAIKILPAAFANEPDRLARFQREAEVLATLNHPNIAQIHGVEQNALVLEFVDGPTLADRIAQGPIPVDEALRAAKQIAEALEAAHERGIIHRDLKPANIKRTTDGNVKVLDFGLAKAIEPVAGSAPNMSLSPTITSPAMTQAGMILGTAAYMSPEQARGMPVDRRTDIWAFGCVFYELLTGKPAFTGQTVSDLVAVVLKSEPDWTALPADTPVAVRALLQRCLRKDPTQRLHDSADARIEIAEAIAQPPKSVETSRRLASFGQAVGWFVAALLAIALVVARMGSPNGPSPEPQLLRMELNMPPGVEVADTASPTVAISPDGRRVAFIGGVGGLRRIYVRDLDAFESTVLRGTETANSLSFSPDGNALAFVSSDRTLKKVSLSDGLVTTLVRDVDYAVGGGVWSRDGRITFIRASPAAW